MPTPRPPAAAAPVPAKPVPAKPAPAKPAAKKPAPAAAVGGLTPTRTSSTAKPVAARPSSLAPKTARPAPSPAPAPVPTVAPTASAEKSSAQSWEQFFLQWPEGIPQRGIVVNQLGEQLPFKAFMVRDDMVLLERTNPDTLGARFLISPFSEIGLVKLTDPIKQATFEAAGYKGTLTM